MNRTVKGYLLTIASAAMFGFVPAAAKLAYANGFGSVNLTFYRNLFAAVMLALLVRAGGERLRISDRREFSRVMLMGLLATTITPLLLFIAYSFIPSGVATTFHFTYPALIILGTALVVRKPVQKGHICCVALCIVGIAMFCTPGVRLSLAGAIPALLSGGTYAAYVILLDQKPIRSMSSRKVTFYMALEAAAVLLIVCLMTDNFVWPQDLAAAGCCALVALLSTVAATVLFQSGTKLIGGPRSSILSTFEPITSILVGVLVFDDPFSARTVFGSLCVVAATAMIAVFDLVAAGKEKSGRAGDLRQE